MRTFMFSDRQVFRDNLATTSTHLRCAPGVNQYHSPRSFFRFRLTELYKFTPGRIGYAPVDGLVAVLLHVLNVQVFKGNELVFIDQLSTFLMREVVAPVRLALVGMTKGVHGLAAFLATFSELFFLSLQPGDVFGVSLHPTLALDLLTIRKVGKGRQAQVKPHNLVSWRQRFGFHNAAKAGIPVADTVTANSQSLTLALKRPVQLDFHIANLGQTQAAVWSKSPVPPCSWVGEAVIAVKRLEARVTGLFLARLHTAEEGAEGEVKPDHRFLHGLGMTTLEPFVFFFPGRQQLDRIVSANTFLPLLPSLFACFKRFVIDKAAGVKLELQSLTLGSGGEKPVLERLAHTIIVSYLAICNKSMYGIVGNAFQPWRAARIPLPFIAN